MRAMSVPVFTAAALADRFALQLHGDGAVTVRGVATLANAGPDRLAFLANPRYRAQLATTTAGVVVLRADDVASAPGAARVPRARSGGSARIAGAVEGVPAPAPAFHASAAIDPAAEVAADAQVGPFVSIGARSKVGPGCTIGPGCSIGEDCSLDAGC